MRTSLYTVVLALALTGISTGAQSADLEDQLQERWFEIEILVFERLDVLDVNVDEQLTLRRPRSWPHNLLEVMDTSAMAQDPRMSMSLSELLAPNPYCLGYPQLSEQDPEHPLFMKENSFGDNQAVVVEERGAAEDAEIDTSDGSPAQPGSAELVEVPANAPAMAPTARELLREEIQAIEQGLFSSSYTWLPTSALNEDVKSINRQRTLRPLIHKRWRQPVPARDAPQPIYITLPIDQRSPATITGYPRIEGFIDVTVSRYLHFATTLWYHADTLGEDPIMTPFNPTYESRLDPMASEPYMQLKESRRLRSGDLHYLDHPKMGILVIVEPVTLPQNIQDRWLQLEESGG
jgi:peptidoglycan-binding protein CsiV